MKLKSLLLGSAAALAAVSGAQAADLPVAEPVEYVRICDAYGTGFFYIPGTETCLKIGGYVRYQASVVNGYDEVDDDTLDGFGAPVAFFFADEISPLDTRNFNQFATLARGAINFDARTATDLGVLRSFIAIESTVDTSSGLAVNATTLDKAYLSLSGENGVLYAGRIDSFFEAGVNGVYATITGIGSDDSSISTNALAYTFLFGNGFSATVSLEDGVFRRKSIAALATGGTVVTLPDPPVPGVPIDIVTRPGFDPDGIYGGNYHPDVVAQLRVDGGWGYAFVSGAVHHIRPVASNLPTPPGLDFGAVESDYGFAVAGAFEVKVPNTMFSATGFAAYGDGAIGYVTTGNGLVNVTDGVVKRVCNTVTAGPAGQIRCTASAVVDDIDTSEAWKIQGGLKAGLTDAFSVGGQVFYTEIEQYDDALGVGEVPVLGQEFTPRLSRSGDVDIWGAAVRADYTVVPGLVASAEVGYESAEFNDDQRFRTFGRLDERGIAADEFDNETDRWGAGFRLQRSY